MSWPTLCKEDVYWMKSAYSSPTDTSLDGSNIICLHSARVKLPWTPVVWVNWKEMQVVTPYLYQVGVSMWCSSAQLKQARALLFPPQLLVRLHYHHSVLKRLIILCSDWLITWVSISQIFVVSELAASLEHVLSLDNNWVVVTARPSGGLPPSDPKVGKISFCHLSRSQLAPRTVGLS